VQVGGDCRLNRGEPLGPRQSLPRKAAPRGHCRRKWARLKGEQHHRRALLALQPGHAVRGVSGTPGILCSARSEDKGWLQTCAGAYCCHSCALRIIKCIPAKPGAFLCCVFFLALCPVHGPSMATAMKATRHGRAQDQCREATRREGRALLRAAMGYRLFLLLLAVRACSVRKRPCALALSSGPSLRICIRPPRAPPPSQVVSNLVLTDYDTSTALLYDASTAEGAGPSAPIAQPFHA
jgi:hypothetical protein